MQVGTFADKAAQENTHGGTRSKLIVFSKILLLCINSGNWNTISISIYCYNYNNWIVLWLANRHVSDVEWIWFESTVGLMGFIQYVSMGLTTQSDLYLQLLPCWWVWFNLFLWAWQSLSIFIYLEKKDNIFYLKFRCNL